MREALAQPGFHFLRSIVHGAAGTEQLLHPDNPICRCSPELASPQRRYTLAPESSIPGENSPSVQQPDRSRGVSGKNAVVGFPEDQYPAHGSRPILSLTAYRNRCLRPRYHSVVSTHTRRSAFGAIEDQNPIGNHRRDRRLPRAGGVGGDLGNGDVAASARVEEKAAPGAGL